MKTKDHSEVISGFLKLPPDRINFEIGRYYLRRGSLYLAISAFTNLIESSPGNPLGYIHRASAYFSAAGYLSACEDLTRAIELDPKLTKMRYYRGWCYERLGEYGNAIDDYSKVIELQASEDKQWDNVFKNPVPSYYCSEVCGFVTQDYIKAISFHFNHASVYSHRGLSYAQAGATNLAIADFRKALELNPMDIDSYAWLAQMESQEEEYES